MAGNFEIQVHGTTAAVARVKGDTERAKKVSRRIAVEGAREAAATMRMLVPVGSDDHEGTFDSLESRIAYDREGVYSPGGAGGGGSWTARAGVRKSPKWPDEDHDPANLVYRGTGIYGPRSRMIESRAGNLMVFKYEGKWFFLKQMKGQKPQTAWVDLAQERANSVVKSAVEYFDRLMKK